jgi:hypothetical protein
LGSSFWRVRSIWSTLELLSSSVLPICFVAADSDAPAPAAIEISASVAYRPTTPKILKLSRGVRQAGRPCPRPIGAPQPKAACLDRHQRRRLLLGCSQATSHSEGGRSSGIRIRHDLLRFGLLHSHRRSSSDTNLPHGGGQLPKCSARGDLTLRRGPPAAGPSPRGPAAPPQGRWATALDRMGMGHLNQRVWEAQSVSIRRMEI